MSADKTLADRIAALAAETPEMDGAARVLSVRGGVLEAMLDEIDQTVLGAELQFETDGKRLALLAGGRRLVALRAVDGVDAPDAILGKPLSMDASDEVAAVAGVMNAFAEGATRLKVASAISNDADVDESVSLTALQSALGITPDDPDATSMQRFLARIGDHAAASILLKDGAVEDSSGDKALLQSLKIAMSTQLRGFLDSRSKTCPSHTDPSLTFCADTLSNKVGMVIAIHGEDIALIAYRASGLGEMCRAWQRVA